MVESAGELLVRPVTVADPVADDEINEIASPTARLCGTLVVRAPDAAATGMIASGELPTFTLGEPTGVPDTLNVEVVVHGHEGVSEKEKVVGVGTLHT